MAKGYYHRSFIILQSKDENFSITRGKDSAGYCKMEVKDDRCKMFLYVQDLKPQQDDGAGYDVFLVSADHVVPPKKIASIYTDERGRGECMLEININDIYQSGYSLDQFHALAVVYKGLEGIQYPLVGYANKRVELDWVGRVKKDIIKFYDNSQTLSQSSREDIPEQQIKTASDKSYVLEIVERDQEQGTIGIEIRDDVKPRDVSDDRKYKKKHETIKRGGKIAAQDEEREGADSQHKWEIEDLSNKEKVQEEHIIADLKEIDKDTAQQDIEKKDIVEQDAHRAIGEEDDMAEQDIQTTIEEKGTPGEDVQAAMEEKGMSEEDDRTVMEEKSMPERDVQMTMEEKGTPEKGVQTAMEEKSMPGQGDQRIQGRKSSEETYWEKAKGYFTKLFDTHKRVYPFDMHIGDEQWVEVPQGGDWNPYGYIGAPYYYSDYYGYSYCDHYIVGLIKEKENVRYVVYGLPSPYSTMPPMFMHGFSRWVAANSGYGMGYWLLFIDAYTGGIAYPY